MKLRDYLEQVRWIQYSPDLAKVFTPTGSILLCWIVFKSYEKNGSVTATYATIQTETGLSERNIETAKKRLIDSGVLQVKNNRLQHETSYSINTDALEAAWQKSRGDAPPESANRPLGVQSETGCPESAKQTAPKVRNGLSTNDARTEQKQLKEQGANALCVPAVSVAACAATGNLPGIEAPQKQQGTSTTSDFIQFRNDFTARFAKRVGSEYDFKGVKDGIAIKRLLAKNSVSDLKNLLDRMEANSYGWSCRRGLASIAMLASEINNIRAELTAPPAPKPWQKAGPIAPVGQFTETKAHDPVEFFKP